jgi:hypothetical protein
LLILPPKPDLVFTNPDQQEILRIRRSSYFPPQFELMENGGVVATISLRSILRNKYTFEFKAGPTWTFYMPLYSILFPGESTNGDHFWVRVGPSKRQWNLLVPTGVDGVQLLSCLAFVHREWWCYS